MSTIKVTDASFSEDVLNADKPVLVDFWAEWCGPCKAIAPALEDIAQNLGDRVKVVKINIDDNPSTPSTYNVKGIPMLMLFKDGEVTATKMGALPAQKLTEWVQDALD
jgi:thioredoxin 1